MTVKTTYYMHGIRNLLHGTHARGITHARDFRQDLFLFGEELLCLHHSLGKLFPLARLAIAEISSPLHIIASYRMHTNVL